MFDLIYKPWKRFLGQRYGKQHRDIEVSSALDFPGNLQRHEWINQHRHQISTSTFFESEWPHDSPLYKRRLQNQYVLIYSYNLQSATTSIFKWRNNSNVTPCWGVSQQKHVSTTSRYEKALQLSVHKNIKKKCMHLYKDYIFGVKSTMTFQFLTFLNCLFISYLYGTECNYDLAV